MSKKREIVFLIGGAGAGKTSTEIEIKEKLKAQSLVSLTTRAPRKSEINGVHYHYVNKDEFYSSQRLNTITINENLLYGVPKSEIEKDSRYLIYSVINLEPVKELIENIKKEGLDIDFKTIFFNIPKEDRIQNLIDKEGYTYEEAVARLKRTVCEEKIEDFKMHGIKIDYQVTKFEDNMQNKVINYLLAN